ncbi:MAG: hypothetical protein K5656_06685 [Lachnospiraceae bacterium]|nr:hypothetical protein [Lachnospiraceae bacterium]
MCEYYGKHKVYIVLSRTGTFVAKGIRRVTGEPYSHVSISFDPELKVMYSFARRGLYNPLNAGFVEERLETGVLGREVETGCAIYCLELPGRDYEKIKEIINVMLSKKEEYGYNVSGMFLSAVHYPVEPDKAFFCSQFIAWLMGQVGVIIADRRYALVKPGDIRNRLRAYMIYEGVLQDYRDYYRAHDNIESRSVLDVEYLRDKGYQETEDGFMIVNIFKSFIGRGREAV